MKILHCLFTMETGGAQILTVDLLNEMSVQHKVCLIIVNSKFNKDLLDQLNNKVSIYYINRQEGSRNPIPLLRLNLLLLKLKPDVIHCHEPQIAKLLKATNAKLLHTIHDVGLPTSAYHLYDKLIAVSDVVCRDVGFTCTMPVTKICNGINIGLFERRTRYVFEAAETIRFIQVSRLLHDKKGQDIFLHALHALKSEYLFSNFKVDFIGSGDSLEYLKTMAEQLGLGNQVHFLGERDREWLHENLCGYHVLVQPSKYEGFGLTVIEGLAAGIPVLASDIDGPAEIISGTAGGFLFRNGDYKGCAGKLYHIVELYRQSAMDELMNKAQVVIKERYAIGSCSKRYTDEYALLTRAD